MQDNLRYGSGGTIQDAEVRLKKLPNPRLLELVESVLSWLLLLCVNSGLEWPMYSDARASGDGARAYFCCFLAASGSFGWHGQPRGYRTSRNVIVVNRRSCCLVKADISEGEYSGQVDRLEVLLEVMELLEDVDILSLRYSLNETRLRL